VAINKTERVVLFRYKKGKSIVHRTNAAIKLIALLALSLVIPTLIARAKIAVLAALLLALGVFARTCGVGFREQIAEARPLGVYLAFFYVIKIIPPVSAVLLGVTDDAFESIAARVIDKMPALLLALVPDRAFVNTFFTILFLVQLSLLFFKTTTGMELREALCVIEEKLRGALKKIPCLGRRVSEEARFSKIFTVFLSFIPSVFEAWNRAERAWQARGGKNGSRKIAALVPALFSVCLYAAWLKARALAAREGSLGDRG
jgi:energy-coupling factor transporter transmembrane protein EcfT